MKCTYCGSDDLTKQDASAVGPNAHFADRWGCLTCDRWLSEPQLIHSPLPYGTEAAKEKAAKLKGLEWDSAITDEAKPVRGSAPEVELVQPPSQRSCGEGVECYCCGGQAKAYLTGDVPSCGCERWY